MDVGILAGPLCPKSRNCSTDLSWLWCCVKKVIGSPSQMCLHPCEHRQWAKSIHRCWRISCMGFCGATHDNCVIEETFQHWCLPYVRKANQPKCPFKCRGGDNIFNVVIWCRQIFYQFWIICYQLQLLSILDNLVSRKGKVWSMTNQLSIPISLSEFIYHNSGHSSWTLLS